MKKCVMLLVAGIFLFQMLQPAMVRAEEKSDKDLKVDKSLDGLSFSVLSYFDYSIGKKPGSGDTSTDYNEFRLTRGYFTARKN